MAELEKKYSDFQQGECKEEEIIEVVDEKICPTCEVDPNFKLPKQWFEIPEAYLNKKVCEYHVRVYESEVNEEISNRPPMGNSFDEVLLEIAALKILRDLDKPINTGTRTQVTNACSVIETYYGTGSQLLGTVYLVGVPAFNFDQIAPNNDPDAEDNDEEDLSSGGEIIIQAKGLFKKLTILRLTLNTYSHYYASAQYLDNAFVIRQEDDIVQRINYRNTSQKLKDFMSNLSDTLSNNEYPRLGYPDIFHSKRIDRIKFVFKDGGLPFQLKSIYVLPDTGCREEYQKLSMLALDPLKNLDNAVIYNFLQNLDRVWNDLTAKETKPWLDWTLEHFYPQYIVDHGDIEDLGGARNGLECLLEDQLGLNPGKVVDSLSREIMSAFKSIEMKQKKNACRELDRLANPNKDTREMDQLDSEVRQQKMETRYENEFKNKFFKDVLKRFDYTEKELKELGFTQAKEITRDNVFQFIRHGFAAAGGAVGFEALSVAYNFVNEKGVKTSFPLDDQFKYYIGSEQQLTDFAKDYAVTKFRNLEDGSFGNQILNSPHYHEAKEAMNQVFEADNLVLDLFKGTKDDPESDFTGMELIPIVGICGLTKLATTALNCLVNGISFDAFIDILVEKSFEFMKINTLDLLFNDLPADFREKLDNVIAEQFGPNVKIKDLLGIKMAAGGTESLKDLLTGKNHAKRVKSLFEKYKDPFIEATEEEHTYISSQIGLDRAKWDQIKYEVDYSYDREEKIYREFRTPEGKEYEIVRVINGKQKSYKRADKYIIDFVKKKQREHKATQPSFLQATARVADSLVVTSGDGPEELSKYEKSLSSLETTALGVKVDAVFDVVFDFAIDSIIEEFAIDDLFKMLRSYPIVDFLLNQLEALFAPDCPNSPVIYPPPNDFLKSLSLDVCDPHVSLTLPVINIPSINWRFAIQNQLEEIVREALFKLVGDIMTSLVSRLLSTLEGALCNLIEAVGGFIAGAAAGNQDLGNHFLNALNEAFCNDGDDPATAQSKAEALADALFSPIMFESGTNPQGAGAKVSAIISSVASTKEILESLVAREGESNDQFNTRVSNAINILSPEMRVLLGSPNQVAFFFRNLGSHLSPDDRQRIRDLLDADIPNLPISSAICLTNEELDEWNDLRNSLLQDQGLTPEQAAERVAQRNRLAEDAVEQALDDLGDLDSGDMLEKAVEREMNKDACNPNNLLNPNVEDALTKELGSQAIDGFYSNIERCLILGFTGNNGIIGEALADFDGNKEFARYFLKILNPNYGNSQEERDAKREARGLFAGALMDALTVDGQVQGQYPKTVGITQREQIISDDYKSYNFDQGGQNVVYRFYDSTEGKKIFGFQISPQTYTQKIIATNIRSNNKSFDYRLRLTEKINNQNPIEELKMVVPTSVSEDQSKYMESIGFQYLDNQEQDIRKAFFNEFARRSIPLPLRDYSEIYEGAFESFNSQVVEMLLTDPREAEGPTAGLPPGYTFGYVNENLTTESMIYYNPDGTTPYNLDEELKTLGKFGSDRIVPLDPSLYGGRYSNPPFYIEPRQFTGWLEIATKAFDSPSGCDPKQPPLISFQDIKQRTKDLSTSLRNDPRLSQDPDCVKDIPFKALLDRKTQAYMDGVVRTTIRSYVAEYFMKGYGLLSNIEMRSQNFDNALFLYIAKRMKDEMYDIGWTFSSSKISITKEKYWYTFLEQCVEAYQRMIDIDGLTPPDEIMEALNEIQKGIDAYQSVNADIKKKMRKRLDTQGNKINKPSANFDPLEVVRAGPVSMGLQAVAYRLTTDLEEKADFFNGEQFDDYTSFEMRFASIKKIKFFQKQYFIALYEKQATLIMSELIRDELNRLIDLVTSGLSDKPYYMDLSKSIFSMFAGSESVVGTNPFYVQKQTSSSFEAGSVPQVMDDNTTPPIAPSDKPQFIVESYARMVDRQDPNLPTFIRNRQQKYIGAISLQNLSQFVNENIDTLGDNYLSDFFGNLTFLYQGSLKDLMDKGFTADEWLARLDQVNDEIMLSTLKDVRDRFLTSQEFEDIDVKYDEAFLLEGEDPIPVDTFGSTGIKYGLRLSIVFPENFLTDNDIAQIKSNSGFVNLSSNEKSYMFDDNSFVLPLVSEEIDVKDAKFEEFDPFSGTERYDLECLINKMVKTADFTLFMENIFNLKQISSMLTIYCMETFMPSLGQKIAPEPGEGATVAETNDSDNYERAFGPAAEPEQDWDGTINRFSKEILRRQFRSLYLSRTIDGTYPELGDSDGPPRLGNLFQLGNPLDIFAIPPIRFPWWQKRRMKTKVYDANGQECADPKKDLT